MSVPLDVSPKIYITFGRIKSAKASAIKFAIYRSLMRAMTLAVSKTILYLMLILPESKFRIPPYPRSYRSERLAAVAIQSLKKSLSDLKAQGYNVGTTRFDLFLGFSGVSYSKHVNLMRGVKWSKPTTKEGFIKISQEFLAKSLNEELRAATVKFKGEEVSLMKFVRKGGIVV